MKTGTPAAIQVIRDEHIAVAAILRSLQPLVEQGPGDDADFEEFAGVI